MAPPASVYNIQPGAAFLEELAQGLMARAGDAPESLADMTVLLPNRRACRALAESFLDLGGGRPMLLPTLRPLGDVDEDELVLDIEAGADDLDLAPAVTRLRRLLLLAELVRKRRDDLDAAQAVRLAVELARLLDALEREDLSLGDLAGITPEAFAAHWQETLAFLQILAEPWQDLLRAERVLDPIARRNLLIRRQAERWRRRPPAGPIIAAGSTGSVPATAELLAVVASLPQGAVVLPGLDQVLDEDGWAALEPSHPQFGLKQLLGALGIARDQVAPWPGAATATPPSERQRLVSEALRPAATTERWRQLGPLPAATIEGMARIDCPGPKEEAGVIALLMRRALERPDATAALVTPERRLARRVAIELRRWGIEVDDSAGTALAATPPGAFLRLVAVAMTAGLAPVPLLAMLKHPLATGGRPAATFNAAVRLLDRRVLRGPRPAPGFEGLAAAVEAARAPRSLGRFVAELMASAAAYESLGRDDAVALPDLVTAHVEFAEWLSRDESGRSRLWEAEAGEVAARFVHELHAAAEGLGAIAPATYPELLAGLMTGQVVRPSYGRHPRLFIWGPLEARLMHADLVILGGLNEGSWPAEAETDPWLSRPMRRSVGLAAPERRIGLAAHDFAQAANARTVVMTRARKVEGTPTVPSRWLLRLDSVLEASGLAWPARPAADLTAWQADLDRADGYEPVLPPAFAPPVEARPDRLSVTRIETWMRDPYAIYARYILALVALEPLEADPGAAERGTAVHQALDRFVAAYPEALPEDAYERLIGFGAEAFAEMLQRPGVRAFWWPRFQRIAAWFLAREAERRRTIQPLATEARGRLVLPRARGDFTLTAHADRIDRLADGRLAIIDYKTGATPSAAEVLRGDAPQLTLEAAIALAGGFEGVPAGPVAELGFWKLGGGREPGEIKRLNIDIDKAVAEARRGLERLVRAFDDPATPYRAQPRPAAAPRFGDYEHLARIKEWSTGGGETAT